MPTTRTLRYQVACSLDGFIAGPAGEFDWIVMDPDIDFAALMGRYDGVLMGRRTWEAVAAMHGGGGAAFGLPTHVVSTTLSAAQHPSISVIAGDIAAGVRALKQRPGKEIWLFGGGRLCASLLDAGLVDLLELAVIPVLLGGGIPCVAPTARRHALRLQEQRIYPKTGTALLTYAVQPTASTQPRRGGRKK